MKTFVMIKPDAIEKDIIGECISAFEKAGLKIITLKETVITEKEAKTLYDEHKEKHFFSKLINFIANEKVIPIILEGDNAITKAREVVKELRDKHASKTFTSANVVHGSDSEKSFEREHKIFFNK